MHRGSLQSNRHGIACIEGATGSTASFALTGQPPLELRFGRVRRGPSAIVQPRGIGVEREGHFVLVCMTPNPLFYFLDRLFPASNTNEKLQVPQVTSRQSQVTVLHPPPPPPSTGLPFAEVPLQPKHWIARIRGHTRAPLKPARIL